ncbi:M3 family metallopeptidase [Flavobacterium sp. SUN046]|uniref:M3 family metallopeptidase n=1 Tax=Flavobacterium sp. SUN046 TaxID=3002440 RepID=UPI002DBD4909|nr:M3 family metallopeptidase [Flavobacterium sp. SUN046]MEC4050227.1 M3 family metallopeptidase [Flavobacterium sp. SUN046]
MKNIIASILISSTVLTMNAQNNPTNPLLKDWTGNYGGVPAFTTYSIADFKPAMEFAMQEKLNEVEAIANNPKPATFKNTIEALEKVGKRLSRVYAVYGIYSSNMSTPEFEPIEAEIEPKLAAVADKITQNTKLFKRIEAVYNSKDKSKLTAEQKRLVKTYYDNYVYNGAKLDAKTKAKVSALNQELAGLYTKFSQNLLSEENNQWVELKSESDFAGLPEELQNAAKSNAAEHKLTCLGAVANTRSSVEPFLTYSSDRALREKVWRMFVNRGDNNNAQDNNATIVAILKLRAQRAKLMGYASHADWKLSNTMAKNPKKAMQLMLDIWKPAVAQVHLEVADMQKIVDTEGGNFKIQPWDYRYYSEKVRKEKYDLDQNEVKQYLQLDKLREGMFWVAGELFDLKFILAKDVPVYQEDVTVYQVVNKTTGKNVGLWYFDPYARKGKRSGAWMNEYRMQERFNGEVPTIVSNNANFIKGATGEPVLISWDDASTLFHEFGHALHGLCSNVNYPLLAGTNVARDYVEFPSQILEHWLSTPEVLKTYALHYKTGEPMPQALLDKIEKASHFNEGFSTVELISSALIDMKLHMEGDKTIDPDAFEKTTLAALNMPSEIVMRHRTPQFGHIFSSDEYSAGYYSYLWADVICADAYEAFTEAKGPYDKEVAKRLLKYVFSSGNTTDQGDAYRSFRGRDAKVDALMRAKGFPMGK